CRIDSIRIEDLSNNARGTPFLERGQLYIDEEARRKFSWAETVPDNQSPVPASCSLAPSPLETNVLSSAFIPVSANKNFVRGTLHIVILFSIVASAAAPFAGQCAAREDPLHEAIASLASEVLAVRNVQSPLRLDWRNQSALSAAESEALQSQFSSELASL